MAGRYGDLDYPTLIKRSFLFGIGLFVLGELGEFASTAAGMPVPGWEHTMLMYAAGIGVLIALLSPFIFGIILPLTE